MAVVPLGLGGISEFGSEGYHPRQSAIVPLGL